MEDPALSKNFVDAAALHRYNFFKGLILVLLAALLLSLWGFTRQFTSIQAPTLTGPDGVVSPGSVMLNGRGTPNSDINVQMDGQSIGVTTVDASGNWSLNTNLAAGKYDFIALALDPDGVERGRSSGLTLTVAEPIALMAADLTLDAPNLGEFSLSDAGQPQAALSLTGTGEPGSQVQLSVGSLDLGMVTVAADGSWSFAGNLTLEPGTYDLQARMIGPDGADFGAAEFAGLVVPVLDEAPALVSAPTLVADGMDDDLSLHGTASPNSTVEILVDGVVVNTAAADADGNWSWIPDWELGAYEIAVRAADNPDLTSDSQMVRVGLPVTIGPAEIVDEGDGTAELTLRGTAVANSQIQLIINGEVVDTVTADAAGNWTYSTRLTNGSYVVNGRYLDLSESQVDQLAASQTFIIGQPTGGLQLLFAGASSEDQPGTAPAGSPAVEIILDASGSMTEWLGDTTRFEAARTSLQNITENVLPDGTPIAVRVFGNIEGNYSCRTDLMIPYQPLDRAAMASFLADVEPQFNANTPIADSLARVQFDLADAGDLERIVVLLTDGKETCGGDPAAQIQKLRDSGIAVQVNIVGLAITDDALKAEFERWAEIGGGQYFDAADPGRLAEVLGEAILVPYFVRNEAGDIVALGRVGGRAQTLPVGTYEVEVRTVPAVTFEMVEIIEREVVQLTLDE